jgi:DNA-binding NtrC family response regulator
MVENRPRILFLEDEEDWIDVLTSYLPDDYEIEAVKSLSEATECLNARAFDLAIVDISLISGRYEDEKGFHFIQELLSTEVLRDMSIIIVTAYPTMERARKAIRDYRVFDFIDKGTLEPAEFQRTVAEAIAKSY